MRSGNLLFSAIQFIFVVAVFLLGGLFIGLEHAPQFRSAVAEFFFSSTSSFSAIGYTILGVACLLLLGFYVMNRGVYYQVEMGDHRCQVEPKIIRSYVQGYWKEIFPEQNCQADVVFHANQEIEVLAELPGLCLEQHKVFLSQIEKDLGDLLASHFGYQRPFLVTVVIK